MSESNKTRKMEKKWEIIGDRKDRGGQGTSGVCVLGERRVTSQAGLKSLENN